MNQWCSSSGTSRVADGFILYLSSDLKGEFSVKVCFLWHLYTGTVGAANIFGFSWVLKGGVSTLPFAFLPSSKHWEFYHVLPLAGSWCFPKM